MYGRTTRNAILAGTVVALFALACSYGAAFFGITLAAKPEKDKTPPVISGLGVEAVSTSSARVIWMTDEPADSDIDYGVAPRLNQHGPRDPALVLSHAISLSGLTPAAQYAFCALSRDEANNRAEACGFFTTASTTPAIDVCPNLPGDQGTVPPGMIIDEGGNCVPISPPPPPPSQDAMGGGRVSAPRASLSGSAYPGARVFASVRGILFGAAIEEESTADADGLFSITLERFPPGAYVVTLTATDLDGEASALRSYQFDFRGGDAPLLKEGVIMPPTLSFARDKLARGDDLIATGYAQPLTRIIVEVGSIGYETVSDVRGRYEAGVNTATFSPGKVMVRARTAGAFSEVKTVILTATSVPRADLNDDGVVDIMDISRFLAKPIDLTGDGAVDAADISVFLRAVK